MSVNSNATRLDFISVQVRNLETSKAFYTQMLGFRPSAMSNPQAIVFEHASGAIFAIRTPLVDLDAVTQLGHGTALWFGVENVTHTFAEFQEKGGKIIRPLQDTPFGKTFVAADPDGYQLTIQQL